MIETKIRHYLTVSGSEHLGGDLSQTLIIPPDALFVSVDPHDGILGIHFERPARVSAASVKTWESENMRYVGYTNPSHAGLYTVEKGKSGQASGLKRVEELISQHKNYTS